MNTRAKDLVGLAVWLLSSFAAGAIGGLATRNAPTFYRDLALPDWAPPASVFGPVWTLLYIMMAVAAWLIWRERDRSTVTPALTLYAVQLIANALWSWLFFAWREGAGSFAEIVLLWVLIAGTLVAFWRIRPLAGMLLLPYLAWVTFAAALNYAAWQQNPGVLG